MKIEERGRRSAGRAQRRSERRCRGGDGTQQTRRTASEAGRSRAAYAESAANEQVGSGKCSPLDASSPASASPAAGSRGRRGGDRGYAPEAAWSTPPATSPRTRLRYPPPAAGRPQAASQATPAVPTTPAAPRLQPCSSSPSGSGCPSDCGRCRKQLQGIMYPGGAPAGFGRQAAHVSTPPNSKLGAGSPDQQKWASTNGLMTGNRQMVGQSSRQRRPGPVRRLVPA